ncbi:volume-regulated anion channel subunit LRRC8A-like [Acropora millepora]|uniref:volume-regulated anion channel subunit LRRC8A-like n=1 Tax=Acropora millepora TaxID=45264 RepID=UPI001CF579DD|nr:volume-regulated anion channel subunit LRRC8A-like [Acropora millepora]
MDLEKPKFDGSKMVKTWWDLVDHYLLAVMFTVSVASVGLQATQDRLICIPVVQCSDIEGNVSSKMSDICNRSPSFVFLTKMSDRRQYDYVDNECYEEMDGFSARYSLIFLAETVVLLAISNFWLKCPDCVNALAHCEHLLSEFLTGELSPLKEEPKSTSSEQSEEEKRKELKKEQSEEEKREELKKEQSEEEKRKEIKEELEILIKLTEEEVKREEREKLKKKVEFLKELSEEEEKEAKKEKQEELKKKREYTKKMGKFKSAFSKTITRFNLCSLTWQYRLRGGVGLIATFAVLLANAICYFLRTGWTQCHLDGPASFSEKYRFFQCTRSMGAYFHVASISLFVLLFLHFIIVCWAFWWSLTGERREPTYTIDNLTFKGDAAFLFHFILHSNYGRFVRLVHEANQ